MGKDCLLKKASIICPFYNEKDNLRELVDRIYRTMSVLCDIGQIELLMVDDGSIDDGGALVRQLKQKYSWIQLISHEQRKGQAAALSSGFRTAAGEVVITMDADLQVSPEDLPLFLEKIEEGYDLVNGIRMDRKESVLLRISSWILSSLLGFMIKVPVKDAASNFTAVRRGFIKDLQLVANDHRFIIPIVHGRGAVRIKEINIRHGQRKKGRSKYSVFKGILAVPEFLSFCFRLNSGYYR